jgi:putative SOS response-associated peptidase YedK
MCANFGLGLPPDMVAPFFGLTLPVTIPGKGNYFPKYPIPTIVPGDGGRELAACRWGLIPHEYAAPDQQPQPFNAKAETVAKLFTFRDSYKHRRCLIPADHFFEWTGTTPKRRFKLTLDTGGPFACAGIWDTWEGDGGPIRSATMLTTKPNELIESIPHHRMPVILDPKDFDLWLDPRTPPERLKVLLRPYPADLMACEAAPRT